MVVDLRTTDVFRSDVLYFIIELIDDKEMGNTFVKALLQYDELWCFIYKVWPDQG